MVFIVCSHHFRFPLVESQRGCSLYLDLYLYSAPNSICMLEVRAVQNGSLLVLNIGHIFLKNGSLLVLNMGHIFLKNGSLLVLNMAHIF